MYYICLLQAEARAEFAEKSVKKLQKEVDRLEGMCVSALVAFSHTNQRFCPVHHLLGKTLLAWLVHVVLLGWFQINISLYGKFLQCVRKVAVHFGYGTLQRVVYAFGCQYRSCR
jgi:hypothetical protein